jgi:hypothetical protein
MLAPKPTGIHASLLPTTTEEEKHITSDENQSSNIAKLSTPWVTGTAINSVISNPDVSFVQKGQIFGNSMTGSQ